MRDKAKQRKRESETKRNNERVNERRAHTHTPRERGELRFTVNQREMRPRGTERP